LTSFWCLVILAIDFIKILGVRAKRLALPELKNELTNRGIIYDNKNKRQKLIEILDKELSQETLANTEGNI
jgi:DNA phosphorothioation-dependent restriction protein DptG